jgi:hypothetical protein
MVTAEKPIYSSRLIKASALIADTKTLLAGWEMSLSVAENLARAQRENLFGKASRSRVEDILEIFRQRYFKEPDVGTALVRLVKAGAPDSWLVPLLYFFSAQSDRTLRDIVLRVLMARRHAGFVDIGTEIVKRQLSEWVSEDRTAGAWGESTIERVAQGALATLRDFGILQGAVNKEIAPVYLPIESFALISLWLTKREGSGLNVLHSEEWGLFFLPVEGVERSFLQADQEHLLTYQSLGSVVRLDYPVDTLEEYACVLVERAHQGS